jgi:hypothetical protein
MKTKKNLNSLISIVGLLLILMMTAASVCAEEPLERDDRPLDQGATTDSTDDNQSDDVPMLIATGETEENVTSDLPDYGNYTGDMLISPGPEAKSDTMMPSNLPIFGIIGAVIFIVVVMVGIVIKQKKK